MPNWVKPLFNKIELYMHNVEKLNSNTIPTFYFSGAKRNIAEKA